MAEQQHQPANELERLSAASAQTCLRAIRSQIAIGYTFCNLAKSQLQTGGTGNARRVVEKLRLLRAGVATQPAICCLASGTIIYSLAACGTTQNDLLGSSVLMFLAFRLARLDPLVSPERELSRERIVSILQVSA